MITNTHISFLFSDNNAKLQEELVEKQNQKYERTCLTFRQTAVANDVDTLKRIFSNNPSVINSNQGKSRKTALYYAVENLKNCKEAYEFLLINGADPSIKDYDGKTVFDLLESGRKDIQSYLLRGQDPIRFGSLISTDWYERLVCYKLCEIGKNILSIKNNLDNGDYLLDPIEFYEAHSSLALLNFLEGALPKLKSLGYKAILFEQGINLTKESFIDGYQNEYKFIRNKLTISNLTIDRETLKYSAEYARDYRHMQQIQNILKIAALVQDYQFEILFNDPDSRIFEKKDIVNLYTSLELNNGDSDKNSSARTFQILREIGFVASIKMKAKDYKGGIISFNGLRHAKRMKSILQTTEIGHRIKHYCICEETSEFVKMCQPIAKEINLSIVYVVPNDKDAIKQTVKKFFETVNLSK